MAAFTLTADFSLFPPGVKLGPSFDLAAFHFVQTGGAFLLATATTAGENALELPNDGTDVLLPVAVSSVSFRVGAFAGPSEVLAIDGLGSVVDRRLLTPTTGFQDHRLVGAGIVKLHFQGGHNETMVARISITVQTCGDSTPANPQKGNGTLPMFGKAHLVSLDGKQKVAVTVSSQVIVPEWHEVGNG